MFPAEPDTPLRWGDRIVSVDGRSPIVLESRVAASDAAIRYDIERAGSRVTVDVTPRPFTWRTMSTHFGIFFVISVVMLAVGVAVFVTVRVTDGVGVVVKVPRAVSVKLPVSVAVEVFVGVAVRVTVSVTDGVGVVVKVPRAVSVKLPVSVTVEV